MLFCTRWQGRILAYAVKYLGSYFCRFKDHRRCSYMIANALDVDGKFTPAQVSRKLKQLGLSVPQKSFGGKMHPKGEDLIDHSKDRMNESDDETLISLIER